MKTEKINRILGIKESYKAPQAMLDKLLDPQQRTEMFRQFLEVESDLSYEWFQEYFENEHSERKAKKQDFTPQSLSKLLSKIGGQSSSYFEAAAGTGGIMIQSWNENENADRWYHVEELSERSMPFLLFNMAIRGINGTALRGDSLTGEFEESYEVVNGNVNPILNMNDERKYQSVLMNPPFSAGWNADKSLLEDERFKAYKKLPPKSKADFSFLLHGYHTLDDVGTMAVIFPHGVLFRGNAEGTIRQVLLENGAIDSIIGLPGTVFRNTSIPTTILVLKKNRENKDVLFIDASKEFEKGKAVNLVKDEHIQKIVETFNDRKEIDKFSHVAGFDEIKDNDFNLNIPRYVDTFEEEEPIDLATLKKEVIEIDREIEKNEKELLSMIGELESTDGSTEADDLIEVSKLLFGGR